MPRPFPKKISQIKPTLSNLSVSSHFAVTFAGLSSGLMTHLKTKGILDRYIADDLSLLCCRASLPGSAHATTNIIGNYQGLAEKMAHTRTFTQMSMEFYVDNKYKSLKFLEHWLEYMSGGSRLDGADPTRDGYYFRMRYPDDYKCSETRIIKFERDYKNYLEYKFINLFPLSLDAIPVSYEGSQILKATAIFSYDYHIAGKSSSLDRKRDEAENDDSSQKKQAKSFAEQYANKNLDGSKEFLGVALPNDMRNSNSSSSRLIADNRFLNGDNALLISEGIRGFGSSSNRGSSKRT